MRLEQFPGGDPMKTLCHRRYKRWFVYDSNTGKRLGGPYHVYETAKAVMEIILSYTGYSSYELEARHEWVNIKA